MSLITIKEKRILDILKSSDEEFAKLYIKKDNNLYITSDGFKYEYLENAVKHEVDILNTVIETLSQIFPLTLAVDSTEGSVGSLPFARFGR